MVRCITFLTLLGLLICLGCGKSTKVAGEGNPNGTSNQNATFSKANEPSPADIVSQFLDQIRRGGEDSGAGDLLTSKARAVLQQIGRTIQPLGSPDARYQVTRFEMVPDEENSALVHSIWSEPDSQGGASDYQVVWAVVRETGGWRISGLVMQLSPDEAPMMVDFENAELMSKMLGTPDEQPGSAATTQAVVPNTEIRR